MTKVYDETKGLWEHQTFGITSNLVLKLKDEHYKFIEGTKHENGY